MSNWKNTKSWNRGQVVESDFSKLLEIRGVSWRKANRQEQFSHVDYYTSFGSIDVKAKKKISRSDSSEQDELIWLEFKNVQGKKGWLSGNADIIAFERAADFVLVRRKELLLLAQNKCDFNSLVTNSRDALYKVYSRKGRKDLISIVKMSDILDLHHRKWKKYEKQ